MLDASNEKPVFGENTGLEKDAANVVSPEIAPSEINLSEAVFDSAAAVKFASRFGFPNVMAFANNRCVHPELPTPPLAQTFVDNNAGCDLYFSPAALNGTFAGKPKKTDCIGSDWVWGDVDPPKGMTDPTKLKEWREQALLEVSQTDLPPPQIIVFSGRGLWFFWHLKHRLSVAEIEAINYALVGRLGGDFSCWNIDHVARLPFTRNSKTGCISTVIYENDGRTDPAKMPSETPPSAGKTSDSDLGDFGETKTLDEDGLRELVAALPCKEDKKNDLLLAALFPEKINEFREKPLNINDRSSVMFSWAIKAIKADMKPEDVRNCILSPQLKSISAHLLDRKKYAPYARSRAAERNVIRAYAQALEHGWKPKTDAPSEGVLQGIQTQEAPPPLQLISLAPVPDDLPARPWLVDGALMDGQVTMLTGRGGEGKSLLALQFGVMVALGTEFAWWNARRKCNVLVLNGEDDINEQRRRLSSACHVMGVDSKTLENRLFILPINRFVLLYRDPEDNKIKTTPFYEQLKAYIKNQNIGLLVIDPLIETHVNLDENSNTDMKELVLTIRDLARRCNIPVLIVHHSRKGAAGGDQDGARGGSSLVNACRVVLTMDRMDEKTHADTIKPPLPKENYVRVTGAKMNYAGRIGDRWLELESVELKNGDDSPGLKRVTFGELEQGFDPRTWPHREAFLKLVRDGRGDGRLWSTAETGKKDARLNAVVSERFKVDAKLSKEIIQRFAEVGMIKMAEQKDAQRKSISVWLATGQEVPHETIEIPF